MLACVSRESVVTHQATALRLAEGYERRQQHEMHVGGTFHKGGVVGADAYQAGAVERRFASNTVGGGGGGERSPRSPRRLRTIYK